MRSLKSIFSSTIIAVSLLLSSTASWAATYYVSNAGSDGNPGTQSAPWRTLQYAADHVSAGDVVLVENGIYVGMEITRDGTASSPITFKANGSSVIVNNEPTGSSDGINIEGGSYIIIEDFIVKDINRVGIRAVLGRGVIIRNNTVRDCGHTNILTGWTPEIQILDNTSSGARGEHGIYTANSSETNDNIVISGNTVSGNQKNGIQVNGDCVAGGDGVISGAIIEDNVVFDNNWKGMSLISMQNSIVANNVLFNNGVSAGAAGIHLADEPGCGLPSNNNIVVNNTVVEPRIACFRMTNSSTNNVIFNNIAINPNSSRLIEDDAGGNIIHGSSNIQQSSSGNLFVNASARDYRLANGSPAIDAGIMTYEGRVAPTVDHEGNSRPSGSAVDIGAYDSGGTPPTTDTENPEVNITTPADNATLSQSTLVEATATDNVGVLGVQFYLDGSQLGPEDTSFPYAVTLVPGSYTTGFYTLTAVDRDATGNTATSVGVTVYLEYISSAGIPVDHPRLWFQAGNGRLAELRAAACYDASGNVIPGCTRTYFADKFFNFITNKADRAEAWHWALAYMITQDISYANTAMQEADAQVVRGPSGLINKFLYFRDKMRNICLVYDWLYSVLDDQRKQDYMNYINVMIFVAWLDNQEANSIHDTGDWATTNPRQNFFYGFILGHTYATLATYHENPGQFTWEGVTHELYFHIESRDTSSPRYTDPLEFLYAKFDVQMWPVLDAQGQGGGWMEGENYGRAMKRHLSEALLLLQQTADVDFYHDPVHPFVRHAVMYQFYAVQPGGSLLYSGGDASQDSRNFVNPYDRHFMLMAAWGLDGTVESQYAKYWCDTEETEMDGISVMEPWDFFLDRPDLTSRNFNELSTRYFAEGMNWVHSRSDWTENAVAVSFISNDRIQGHQHRDQNSVVIYRGGPGNPLYGWILTDAQPFSSTLRRSSYWHNTITISGGNQRFGWGTGDMIKHEFASDYSYAVGDASDAYWTNPGDYSHGDDKMVDIFHREVVHVLPEYIVVFDRVTLAAGFENEIVEVNWHYPYNQPAADANGVYMNTTGEARLFHKILVPDNPTIVWLDEEVATPNDRMETWRMEITDPVQKTSYQFLNVFQAAHSSVSSMPATEKVLSATGNMVGALIKDNAEEQVLMFSTDPAGTPPAGVIQYEVGANLRGRHRLFDLIPYTGYQVELTRTDEGYQIEVVQGGEYYASPAGVLEFRLGELVPEARMLSTR